MSTAESPRRIMIAGGSGLIGRHLAGELLRRGDEVLVLSRDPARAQPLLPGCAVLAWRPGSDGMWQDELEVVDGLIDLSGPRSSRGGEVTTTSVRSSARDAPRLNH